MANKRLFYAAQRVGIAPINSNSYTTVRGAQSVGLTTIFNIEQVSEIGQLESYETIEGIPAVEVSTEKVLDGYCPIYLLATQTTTSGSAPSASTLSGRATGVCRMAIAAYPEESSYAEGTIGAETHMSGLFVSSVGYSVPVEGNATESCSLVGNNKVWVIGGNTGNFVGYDTTAATWLDSPWSDGDLEPLSIGGSGGVNQRQDILFGSGASASLLPTNIPGITAGGYNVETGTNGYGAHIQGWNINADLGRTEMFELGRKGVYNRYVNFPVEVTNEISVITASGDMISATEEGIFGSAEGCGMRYNLTNQTIKLCMCEGLVVDCGTKNKLSTVSRNGGGSDGGNVEISYSYTNNNSFDVKHPQDPVEALRP
jgi:hypothetical protein